MPLFDGPYPPAKAFTSGGEVSYTLSPIDALVRVLSASLMAYGVYVNPHGVDVARGARCTQKTGTTIEVPVSRKC
jgi:hypothetical protein